MHTLFPHEKTFRRHNYDSLLNAYIAHYVLFIAFHSSLLSTVVHQKKSFWFPTKPNAANYLQESHICRSSSGLNISYWNVRL